ncbi:integrating conjugative element protein [Salmonella enterica]|uniref:integrating conjugative element protein n=1 Tax=Salmonella enterica TaxID=28901 RepID=UPI00109D2A7A|nr:integrating conjugative element protein [Salmonella enterica]MBA2143304.1 integrating conjugative element protein [Salmonella enterica subsp. diarizonae serovar 38:l,v:z13:z53]EAW7984079.1 integrating conjugative element protein [Salmonella enterica]EAY4774802.1 integrating conjugative element protein [Salmonella enterica]EBA7037125.1 integrating conjugative element protein [Salmonella enterica]EBH0345244.1 integrating conjugative element protein [Salmonella enterica]
MRPAFCLLFIAFLAPAADKYQYQQQGAISDWMYYRIGGGAAIPPSATRRNTFPLTAGVSWNSDMMCGNFDIDTTVRNQLNGVTDGFQQLMGEVIESATSAVASLPAMVIQRANPQLYDLLTNGVLQGRLDFDKSLLSCQKMAGKMTDYALSPAWTQSAQAENYQGIAASEKDAVRADQRAAEKAAEKGKRWVGGEHRGGKGQPPIKLVRDTTVAGYNILNNRSATSTSSVSSNDCQGELCQVWSKPDDAAQWLTRVVGEQTINVAPDNDQSGDTDQQSGAQSSVGLTPLIQEEQDKIQPLMARRTLLAGMREPNVSDEKEAQTALTQTTAQLDQELSQLKLELDMHQALADNAALTILERQTMRAKTKGQAVGVEDDTDKRMDDLSKSTGGETQ